VPYQFWNISSGQSRIDFNYHRSCLSDT
jgi:hypothetical protein